MNNQRTILESVVVGPNLPLANPDDDVGIDSSQSGEISTESNVDLGEKREVQKGMDVESEEHVL